MAVPFESPTTILVVGPTQCGKTHFTRKLIEHKDDMFSTPLTKVIYAYGAWQEAFESMKNVEFHEGLPDKDKLLKWSHCLLVIDDLMQQACASPDIMNLFTVQCHHQNITVMFLTQNIFPPGKYARSVSLNSHYVILFRSKRGVLQIQTFGRQILPGEMELFNEAYEDAIASQPYGYLLCDLHPATDKRLMLRTCLFPGEYPRIYTSDSVNFDSFAL